MACPPSPNPRLGCCGGDSPGRYYVQAIFQIPALNVADVFNAEPTPPVPLPDCRKHWLQRNITVTFLDGTPGWSSQESIDPTTGVYTLVGPSPFFFDTSNVITLNAYTEQFIDVVSSVTFPNNNIQHVVVSMANVFNPAVAEPWLDGALAACDFPASPGLLSTFNSPVQGAICAAGKPLFRPDIPGDALAAIIGSRGRFNGAWKRKVKVVGTNPTDHFCQFSSDHSVTPATSSRQNVTCGTCIIAAPSLPGLPPCPPPDDTLFYKSVFINPGDCPP